MTITLTLSEASADIIQSRIEKHGYPDAQAVIDAALSETEELDEEIDTWLRDVVAPSYDALEAGTMQTYAPEQVRERLAQHAARYNKKSAA